MAKYKVEDIANWILKYNRNLREISNEDTDEISNLKLQKLLYYAQGAYLAMRGEKLFDDEIVAWTHGPVIEEMYNKYKKYGASGITEFDEDVELDNETLDVIVAMYDVFGKYSAWGLRNLTHKETPWKETKRGEVIDTYKIKKYFEENYI